MCEGAVVAIAGAAADGVLITARADVRPVTAWIRGPFGLNNFLRGTQPTGIVFARLRLRHRRA